MAWIIWSQYIFHFDNEIKREHIDRYHFSLEEEEEAKGNVFLCVSLLFAIHHHDVDDHKFSAAINRMSNMPPTFSNIRKNYSNVCDLMTQPFLISRWKANWFRFFACSRRPSHPISSNTFTWGWINDEWCAALRFRNSQINGHSHVVSNRFWFHFY